jgi:uncharacterized membrane protein YdjX (TVP38/TMEM64 family)
MLQQVLEWIQNLGFWAPIIFILIYIIATVLLISGAVLTLGAGAIFGLVKGYVYVSIASTLGATAAFLIGRYLAREWVAKQIENKPRFQAVDGAVAKQGWKIVGLTRLSPVFPFVFLNYAFSITQVSTRDYILASWLGMLPGTLMYVYLGSLARDLASLGTTSQENNNLVWILRIIGLIATVAVTLYITKIAKQALAVEIDSGDSL